MSDTLWPGLVSWVVLYCSDYFLTIRCARMYRAGVRDKIVFEGSYELTPYFQKDIDALRSVSPWFVLALFWTSGLLALVWYLTKELLPWPDAYLFFLGAFILVELTVHIRHLRNLYLFRIALRPDAIRGRIEYRRFLLLRLSALELATFSALYLVIFLVTHSSFVLGGAVMCLSTAWTHWRAAHKEPQQSLHAPEQVNPPDDAPVEAETVPAPRARVDA
jgi:hypothetical protein